MPKYYVTMTDSFMSGWGLAEEKINKLVFECKNNLEAQIVYDNAKNRTDMKYVNICFYKPYYNKKQYLTQYENKETYPHWYKTNYFANQKLRRRIEEEKGISWT